MSNFIKDGETYTPDVRDLDELQLAVRAATAQMSMVSQQQAASTDPVKLMVDAPAYATYDQRIRDAWRDPANTYGPDTRAIPPTSSETQRQPADEPALRQLVDSPHYQQYDRRIASAWENPVPVIINGGRHE